MKLRTLIVLYLAIVLLPLALAWSLDWPARSFWDEAASAAGMLAFSIILAEFLLSGRFRTISGGVGLDVTLRLHQLIARSALALALIHPFLYQANYSPPRPWDPTRQLTLTADLSAIAWGIAAWILLPTLVLLAIGRSQLSFKYETWRLMHGVGAALIAGFTLMHALEAGRYSADPSLRLLWQGMFAVAVISLIFIYFISPLLKMRKRWRVAGVESLGPGLWELSLDPDNHDGLDYSAGQFAWFSVGKKPFSLHENPFSISSAPSGGSRLSFVIKELGDFTRGIGRIEPGTRAYLDGPHGNLTVEDRKEPGIALIAGGVGIAPLIGILRQLKLDNDPRPTVLIYGNRIEEQIVHREELEELERVHGTQVIHVLSEPSPEWPGRTGLIGPDLVREVFQAAEMKQWVFAICGPPAMMTVVEETLSEIGIASMQVLSERFTYD